jgi:hypothetical protein
VCVLPPLLQPCTSAPGLDPCAEYIVASSSCSLLPVCLPAYLTYYIQPTYCALLPSRPIVVYSLSVSTSVLLLDSPATTAATAAILDTIATFLHSSPSVSVCQPEFEFHSPKFPPFSQPASQPNGPRDLPVDQGQTSPSGDTTTILRYHARRAPLRLQSGRNPRHFHRTRRSP